MSVGLVRLRIEMDPTCHRGRSELVQVVRVRIIIRERFSCRNRCNSLGLAFVVPDGIWKSWGGIISKAVERFSGMDLLGTLTRSIPPRVTEKPSSKLNLSDKILLISYRPLTVLQSLGPGNASR